MTMLDELVEKVVKLPIDEQLRQVCDKIQIEEQEKFKDVIKFMPVGPNIFLSVSVPEMSGKEVSFLCLEREYPGQYISSLWTKNVGDVNKSIKRMKVWEIKDTAPKKILEAYAKLLKFKRGN